MPVPPPPPSASHLRMKVLHAVSPHAGREARRIAADQASAMRALDVTLVEVGLTAEDTAPPPPADVTLLVPGPDTTEEQAVALARRAPLLLYLESPEEVGAALAPYADQVVVPSRHALVHLLDRVALGPRVGRILFPGTPLVRRSSVPDLEAAPLRLLHLGSRGSASGLEDLAPVLAGLPEGSVRLDAVGPPTPQDATIARLAGSTPVAFHPSIEAAGEALGEAHLAVFPWREPGRYALGVDDALALGVPVWLSGGEAVRERYDASAFTALPVGEPEAWREGLEAWLADPTHAREAYAALPDRVPCARDAAAVLVRWSRELLESSREHDDPAYQ